MRAEKATTRASQRLDLRYAGIGVKQQLRLANYRALPEHLPTIPDAEEINNNSLWERVMFGNAHAEQVLRLNSFFLFEWLPRAPGQYFAPEARNARHAAYSKVLAYEDGMAVLHPAAKTSLIQAGVGSVRLKPILVGSDTFYLMGASSDGNCDEGFPIAVSPGLYQKHIQEIRNRGCVNLDIIGRLKFVPKELDALYRTSTRVPQLYLVAEDLRAPSHPKSRSAANLEVNISCLFEGKVDGKRGQFLALRAVDWLEDDYIKGRFNGNVLTDFDQTQRNFADAPFSLESVFDTKSLSPYQIVYVNRLSIDAKEVEFQRATIRSLEVTAVSSTVVNQSGTGNLAIVNSILEGATVEVNNNLASSKQPEEVKLQIVKLTEEIERLKSVDQPTANKLAKNIKKLSEEAAEAEPDRAWYELSLKGIKEAAQAVGAAAEPVVGIVKSLWPVLVGTPFPF
jgi:hypothetical protein